MKDYYSILGIEKDASDDDIKKAYRTLAKEYHPDINKSPDASEKFKEVSEAYNILSNADERRKYDRAQEMGVDYSSEMDFDIHDIFSRMFGGMRNPFSRKPVNDDIISEIYITPQETLKDIKKTIKLNRKVCCSTCDGKGGHDFKTCDLCQGRGVILEQHIHGGMVLQSQRTCSKCMGTKRTHGKTCNDCSGKGYVIEKDSFELEITPDMFGRRIELSGKGHLIHPDSPPGDAIFSILATEKDGFQPIDMRGNVGCEMLVDPVMAILGGEISILNLEGNKMKVKIPAGVKYGQRLELKGQGMRNAAGRRGNLIGVVKYSSPKLSLEQKNILNRYIKTLG